VGGEYHYAWSERVTFLGDHAFEPTQGRFAVRAVITERGERKELQTILEKARRRLSGATIAHRKSEGAARRLA
jgi:hypothetical protein